MQMEPIKIYFDNASTTKLNTEILSSYNNLLATYFENSDALHEGGTKIKTMMEKSRKAIAAFFNLTNESIIFTSGASEANNLAIKGVCFNNLNKKHIITSSIEHSSVLKAMMQLRDVFNFELTILPVNRNGQINPDDLKKALRKDTILVSIMYVNNEVGSINDIQTIGQIVKKYSDAYFHVDMVQAIGKLPLFFNNIDLASFSAHKINGLKGSGFLVKKPHVRLLPLINGGQQEFGLRGGTSNALVNILLYKTIRLCYENKNDKHIYDLNDYLIKKLKPLKSIHINSPKNGVKNIVNFSCYGIFSEIMMNALSEKGIMVSAQSTCSSKSGNPSRVLQAMGFDEKISHTCIRISFSCENTFDEIDYFIDVLKEIIKKYGDL